MQQPDEQMKYVQSIYGNCTDLRKKNNVRIHLDRTSASGVTGATCRYAARIDGRCVMRSSVSCNAVASTDC
jgi:hypothetical protein